MPIMPKHAQVAPLTRSRGMFDPNGSRSFEYLHRDTWEDVLRMWENMPAEIHQRARDDQGAVDGETKTTRIRNLTRNRAPWMTWTSCALVRRPG